MDNAKLIMLDRLTPEMRHTMEVVLSVQERRVVSLMAREDAITLSPAHISKALRIWQRNHISAILRRLVAKGVVVKAARSSYSVNATLREWLRMRRGIL